MSYIVLSLIGSEVDVGKSFFFLFFVNEHKVLLVYSCRYFLTATLYGVFSRYYFYDRGW